MLVASTRISPVWPPSRLAAQVDDVGVGRVDRQGDVVVALAAKVAFPPRIG